MNEDLPIFSIQIFKLGVFIHLVVAVISFTNNDLLKIDLSKIAGYEQIAAVVDKA